MRERGILRRSLGWLAGIAAAVLIVLAVVVGLARLLLPLAPDYQDRDPALRHGGHRLRRAVPDPERELAPDAVRKSASRTCASPCWRTSARCSMPGSSASASMSGGSSWTAGCSPGRIAVSGASVKAERLPTGQWLVNTVFLDELLRRPRNQRLPRLDLQLRDIELVVDDPSRLEPRLALGIRQLDLDLGPRLVGFAAEVDGRDGLGSGIELAGTVPAALLPSGRPPDPAAARNPWPGRCGRPGPISTWRGGCGCWPMSPFPWRPGAVTWSLQASLRRARRRRPSTWIWTWDPRSGRASPPPTTISSGSNCRPTGNASAGGWEATLGRFAVERDSRTSPAATGSISYRAAGNGASASLTAAARNLRLQDLWPIVWSVASTGLRRDLLPERLEGEVSDFKLTASLPAGQAADLGGGGQLPRAGAGHAGAGLGGHRRHGHGARRPVRRPRRPQVPGRRAALSRSCSAPTSAPAAPPASSAGSARSRAWRSSVTTCRSRRPTARAGRGSVSSFPRRAPSSSTSRPASWRRRHPRP